MRKHYYQNKNGELQGTEHFTDFGQAKFPDDGSVLCLSQFLVVPQLPPNMMLGLKEIKNDSK